MQNTITIRGMLASDREILAKIVNNTPQFTQEECQCAVELIDIYNKQGERSGYDFFVSIDSEEKILGYICFGNIPLTDACYDIYWIVVDGEMQHMGIGAQLVDAVEAKLSDLNARKLFVETSSQEKYASAQKFYEKKGFKLISHIEDFYKIGDGKMLFLKNIERRYI
jgi:ribosomal protein S18 acetylase RimI-like enzyme